MTVPGAVGTAEQLSLRAAIAHEWLDAPGGAENVLRQMMQLLPEADVWSLWCRSPARETIPGTVQTTWLARTPVAGNKVAALPLMPLAWRMLPPRDYEMILTSSYALAHTARFRGCEAPALHYVHTPARYWWTPEVDARAGGKLAAGPRRLLRLWDGRMGHQHRYVAANSEATRRRIGQFWRVDARVINPPVDTEFFRPGVPNTALPFDEYVMGASRWVGYKRLDLVIQTADRVGMPVVVAGSGPEEPRLRQLAASVSVPVHFELQPDRSRLRDLYRGAKALVFPVHEDFGIVPVEAMACGTPVVGPAVGGLLETVEDGVSGFLASTAEPLALARALSGSAQLERDKVAQAASRFSDRRFRSELASWIVECTA